MYKFHEEKNQHATSFTNKDQLATSSNINQFNEENNQFTSFTKRRLNMQRVA